MRETMWKPIESAPKDGTEILAIHREIGPVTITRFHHGEWQCTDWDENEYIPCTWEPTHWMPLPEPPK